MINCLFLLDLERRLSEMSESILSVGIDIGTSTTCLAFCRLEIANLSSSWQIPDVEVVNKKIIYRSPIYFTPLKSNTTLDADSIAEIIEKEYQRAGINPGDVETGAVIVTGDTARKENAQAVISRISGLAGDFVAATVGPEFESVLAGRGSGAQKYSAEHTEIITNCDIGGGTSNSATFYDGRVTEASCMDIGGRLIRFKENTLIIEYIYPKTAELAGGLGIEASEGRKITPEEINRITDEMAHLLLREISKDTVDKTISFSGGVGRLIYEKSLPDDFIYNDIGVCLARSIKKELKNFNFSKVIKPEETTGATVIGTSNYSMEVSGSTIHISSREALPMKNVPIATVKRAEELSKEELIKEIHENIAWRQNGDEKENIAVALTFERRIGFAKVKEISEAVVDSIGRAAEDTSAPLIVILKSDYGKVMGQTIKNLLPPEKDVLCIDNVDTGHGDYMDIGAPLRSGEAVPIVIKTLAFSY